MIYNFCGSLAEIHYMCTTYGNRFIRSTVTTTTTTIISIFIIIIIVVVVDKSNILVTGN